MTGIFWFFMVLATILGAAAGRVFRKHPFNEFLLYMTVLWGGNLVLALQRSDHGNAVLTLWGFIVSLAVFRGHRNRRRGSR